MLQTVPLQMGLPGGPELLIILLLAVLLFGANKLPKLARSTGEALGEFQKGREEVERELQEMREGATAGRGDTRAEVGQSAQEATSAEVGQSAQEATSAEVGQSAQEATSAQEGTPAVDGGTTSGSESTDATTGELTDEDEVIRESDFQWGG